MITTLAASSFYQSPSSNIMLIYQTVSDCDAEAQRRSVQYSLTAGNTCLHGQPEKEPPEEVLIQCTHITRSSGIAIAAYVFSGLGVLICLIILIYTFYNRNTKIIRNSQPIFIYLFIIGAILMNLSIITLVGPNNDTTCLLRPWCIDITSTLMFAPLIMKLNRLDLIFNNPSLKKMEISDLTVSLQVIGLILVDVIILAFWTGIQRPRVITQQVSYSNVRLDVTDHICNTGLNQVSEIIMVVWKALQLVFGVYKAINTWNIPSDLSEAKYFSVAIYNITMFGGLAYFLSIAISSSSVAVGVRM